MNDRGYYGTRQALIGADGSAVFREIRGDTAVLLSPFGFIQIIGAVALGVTAGMSWSGSRTPLRKKTRG
jgi:hypothetical protein